MSIKDIIAAATPGPWYLEDTQRKVVSHTAGYRQSQYWNVATVHSGSYMLANADFISTFDPEHVALMEAVIDEVPVDLLPSLAEAVQTLDAYRKGRGL